MSRCAKLIIELGQRRRLQRRHSGSTAGRRPAVVGCSSACFLYLCASCIGGLPIGLAPMHVVPLCMHSLAHPNPITPSSTPTTQQDYRVFTGGSMDEVRAAYARSERAWCGLAHFLNGSPNCTVAARPHGSTFVAVAKPKSWLGACRAGAGAGAAWGCCVGACRNSCPALERRCLAAALLMPCHPSIPACPPMPFPPMPCHGHAMPANTV